MHYSHRLLESALFTAFEGPFITGLLGSRRVGKSTLIQHFLKRFPQSTVAELNMDKMAERAEVQAGRLEDLILTTIKSPLSPNLRVWVFIDEAQKCPELFEQVKVLYDQYKDQNAIKFILTGSARLELHRLSTESLAGRIQLFHLSAFGLTETLQLKWNLTIKESIFNLIESAANEETWQEYMVSLKPLRHDLISSQQELLVWGGLPEVLSLQQTDARLNYLGSYLQTYLERDVLSSAAISDLILYRQLMDIVSEQTGSIRDDSRIVQALSCHRETLHKYRRYLEASLMYKEVYPYINSNLKRLVKSPKGYLINNGLIAYLQGMNDLELLVKSGKIDARAENWLLNELTIWLSQSPVRSEIYYWRTATGVEVDFIVKKGAAIYPFEITYTSHIEKKKIRNLLAFKEYEPLVDYCYYIYNGDFAFDAEQKIVFIPMWAVC